MVAVLLAANVPMLTAASSGQVDSGAPRIGLLDLEVEGSMNTGLGHNSFYPSHQQTSTHHHTKVPRISFKENAEQFGLPDLVLGQLFGRHSKGLLDISLPSTLIGSFQLTWVSTDRR